MQYINTNILCLTYDEYISFFGSEAYKSDKKRGLITIRGIGGNGRKVLIEYESLKPARQKVITDKIGNPYEYLAKQPILDLIDWDYEAQKFYSEYVLPNGDMLPNTDKTHKGKPQINYVERYTKAASWLSMIDSLTGDKRALKSLLNLSVMDFWDTITELILKEGVAIPANPKRLKAKIKLYKEIEDKTQQYISLIDFSKFGNTRSAKIKDQESEALLYKLLSDPRKHDYTVVAAAYNIYAKNAGKDTVSPGAIGYFARNNEHIIAPLRDGLKKAANVYSKDIQRNRASAPLLFINADDNCLDLFFEVEKLKPDGKTQKSKHYRPMLYVIIDTYNDYILGYAVGDTVTHELVYSAFRNAINHIAELTGGYYLPHQLQTDRWGLDVKYKNELGQFYKKVAKFTPQAHGVPQGKYIERSFGTEWHQVLKVMPTNNYAGQNITAKERLSSEYIIEASKNYPKVERMPEIVASFINVMRLKANPKTGISRQQEWMEAFEASEKSKAKAIDTGLKLQLFGKKYAHEATITKAGLKPVINKQKITLDIPADVIWQHNGKKVDIIYDPENLNEMMVTDGKNLRFIAGQYMKVPGALADYEPGDGKRIHGLFEEKKNINRLMANTIQERMLALPNINAQSLLQGGVLLKDLKNDAEAEYLEALYQPKEIAAPTTKLPAAKREPKQAPEQEETKDEIDFYDLY
ncbi:hypothetical protein H7F33_05645 [Pedobacter sp. PAMC26386]|nr:hypothetical protein H7F33_05645 [Pedobacter sp. PAMC26386]